LPISIAGEGKGDCLKGSHWQSFARECGLNPKQVVERVGALAKPALAEADAAAAEVAAMPAGHHEVLNEARRCVETRAHAILAQLQEVKDRPAAAAKDEIDCDAFRSVGSLTVAAGL
jgi:hypothetical protein